MSSPGFVSKPIGIESLDRLRGRLGQMTEELAALVDIESPSSSLEALSNCASYLSLLGTSLIGKAPQRIEVEGRVHLLWQFGDRVDVVMVGHYDTVHQLGTVLRFPFSVDGNIAKGPGACDMKGGIVVALHAIREIIEAHGIEALDGVALFINGDEEIGSPTSLETIKSLAGQARWAIGFENASAKCELKLSRKGRSGYELHVAGRAAHAGERPQDGVNALGELCSHYDEVVSFADAEKGTSVTPTMARAGMTLNTVPDTAVMWLDVRCWSANEQLRVDYAVRGLRTNDPNASIDIVGGINHPPLPPEASAEIYDVATGVAERLQLSGLRGISVGGTADTCTFAGAGVKAIDGLGAAGGEDHPEREWIELDSLPVHAALAAGIVCELLADRDA